MEESAEESSLGLIDRDGEVLSGLGRAIGGERERKMSGFAAGETGLK